MRRIRVDSVGMCVRLGEKNGMMRSRWIREESVEMTRSEFGKGEKDQNDV